MRCRVSFAIFFSAIWFNVGSAVQGQLPDLLHAPFMVELQKVAVLDDVVHIRANQNDITYYGISDWTPIPDGSGRTALTTYNGRVRILEQDGTVQESAFLDLSVSNVGFEYHLAHGFTTIAFHPGFAEPESRGYRKFYTIEPESNEVPIPPDFEKSIVGRDHHDEVVYEYTISQIGAPLFDGTKREILRVQQPGYHHNMGDLVFGNDGLLYVSSGDGSNTGNARQEFVISDNSRFLDNVFGKILRIDPLGSNSENGKYGIPVDNPFVDGPGGNIDEIYAYGIRNPYRLAVDRTTGDLYASETGQLHIESVNRIVRGGNHGWNIKEGSFLYDKTDQNNWQPDIDFNGNGIGDVAEKSNLIDPIFEYDHDDGTAVIGGFLYRGNQMPQLRGMYLFADYKSDLYYGDPESGVVHRLPIDPHGEQLPFRIYGVAEHVDGSAIVYGVSKFDKNWRTAAYRISTLAGDFDNNGILDIDDLDSLHAQAVGGSNNVWFDLDGNGIVAYEDLRYWVEDLKHTSIGDVNLDGIFNSRDLVHLFRFAEYENQIKGDSTWRSGDWNADGDFTSSDLVLAFIRGRYSDADTARLVPETTGSLAVILLFFRLCVMSRRS